MNWRPGLVDFLEAISLDAIYERAEGDRLWQRRGDQLAEILDMVGGFGANLFGHYHPDLVAEDRRLLDQRVPIHAQGSYRSGAVKLAKALCDRLGDYAVIFTNSGTETLEAALKHAYLERRRPLYWGIRDGFHGKTLGSIQLTYSYREPYSNLGPRVHFLNPFDPTDWEAARNEADLVSAAVVEPILGEGGVKPLPWRFIEWLTDTCRAAGIPIVADEVQTGLGRTGTFLASAQVGLTPDYICLSKALGGGLAKIGALLIQGSRFIEEFSVKHTSTFAEDDRSCLLGLKALEILDRDSLPDRCGAAGRYLIPRLNSLQARFPEEIKEVRGLGLMVGIELHDQSESPSNALRMLSQHKYLGYMAAAYLLHIHDIRIAPTLSQPFTLRVEPSAYIAEADLDRLVDALTCLCAALQAADAGHLTGFQIGQPRTPIVDYRGRPLMPRQQPQTERRVAFIGHLILPEHVVHWDPSLQTLPPSKLEAYMAKPARFVGPTVFEQVNVRSLTGDRVHVTYVGLDLTAQQIVQAMEHRDMRWVMEKIDEAVTLARSEDCQIVGLGGYISIISGNCRRIKTTGIGLTSGNSLTVGMGIKALASAARATGIELSRSRLAVLGATGNIGTTYAMMMAPNVAELVLLVRDVNSSRLRAVVEDLRTSAPGVEIIVTDNRAALRQCPLIVAASNTPEPLIFPDHLGSGPIVICDISVPADVAAAVTLERPDVLVIQGGVVRLPFNEDFRIAGVPLDQGHLYACMAETMIMGLEGMTSHGSYGPVTPEGVEWAMALAEKHGFTLGRLQLSPSQSK